MKQNRVTEGLMRSSSSFLAVFQNAKGFPNIFKPRSSPSTTPSKKAIDVAKFLKAFGTSRPSPATAQTDGPQDLLHDLELLTLPETIEMLEAVARQAHGGERIALVKAWCNLMQHGGPRISQAPTPDTSATQSATSSPHNTPRTMKQQQQAAATAAVAAVATAAQQQPTSSRATHRRSQSWQDNNERRTTDGPPDLSSADDKTAASVSFRELFLQTQALEHLLQGYLEVPSEDPDEQQAVAELLRLSLLGVGQEQAQQLSAAWMKLASAASGTPLSSSSAGSVVVEVASQAIASLKCQAAVDQIDQQLQAVQQELALLTDIQAASGANTADQPGTQAVAVRSSELLKGAQQVWELTCLMESLAAQRQAILDKQNSVEYSALLSKLEQPQQQVREQLQQVNARLADAQSQIEQGTGFRSDKFSSLRGVLVEVMEQISKLEAQKAELIAQLAQVDDDLKKLYRRQNLLEEERDVFEEGNAIMLEGLQGCVKSLNTAHANCVQEGEALSACGSLVEAVEQVAGEAVSSYREDSLRMHVAAIQKVLAAGCQYCELHCQEVTECVKAMKQAAEGVQDIDQELMESIMEQETFDDMQNKRTQLLQRHQQSEATARTALVEFTATLEAMAMTLARLQHTRAAHLDTATAQRSAPSETAATPSARETRHAIDGATSSSKEGDGTSSFSKEGGITSSSNEGDATSSSEEEGDVTSSPSKENDTTSSSKEPVATSSIRVVCDETAGKGDGRAQDVEQARMLESTDSNCSSRDDVTPQTVVSRASSSLQDVLLHGSVSQDEMSTASVAEGLVQGLNPAGAHGTEHTTAFWAARLKELLARMDELKTSLASVPRPRGTFSNIMTAAQMMDNRGSSFLSDSSQPSTLGIQLTNTDHVSYSSLMGGGGSPELLSPNSHSDPQVNELPLECVQPSVLLSGDVYFAANRCHTNEEGTTAVGSVCAAADGTVDGRNDVGSEKGKSGAGVGSVHGCGDAGQGVSGVKGVDDGLFSPDTEGCIKAVHDPLTH